jgi:alcohol dehydrogenase
VHHVLWTLPLLQEGHYGLCTGGGGWIFGHLIDGLQAEFARVPFADTSVFEVPDALTDEQVLFLADILPTAYEVGVLNGRVEPGDTVVVVGAGPIGLATIITARLHTPGRIVAVDLADSRLEKAREFGADVTIDNGREDAVALVMELTGGLGADVAIEAVGVPETFELCTELIRPGGRVANVGVHGHSATLHLEKLWIRDVLITTGLVDTATTPKLMKLIEGGKLDPTPFATHRFPLADAEKAYDVFAAAAETNALKVVLHGTPGGRGPARARGGAGARLSLTEAAAGAARARGCGFDRQKRLGMPASSSFVPRDQHDGVGRREALPAAAARQPGTGTPAV